MATDITIQIQEMLNKNELEDLERAISYRKCLNITNMSLTYLFHLAQTAGILTTTIAAGYGIKELVWIGVGMNCLATFINVCEHTNNNISARLLGDIKAMKAGTFIGESNMVEPDEDNKKIESK
jgi:hypothetical protein